MVGELTTSLDGLGVLVPPDPNRPNPTPKPIATTMTTPNAASRYRGLNPRPSSA